MRGLIVPTRYHEHEKVKENKKGAEYVTQIKDKKSEEKHVPVHAMKTYGKWRYKPRSYITSAVD
jgi:hypothetical protein